MGEGNTSADPLSRSGRSVRRPESRDAVGFFKARDQSSLREMPIGAAEVIR
jgi:hypothetical protein